MKRLLPALLLVLAAPASFAAVQYEFRQLSRSNAEGIAPTDYSGVAIVDGARSRVEFTGGNVYPPGTYVISGNSLRTLRFVDPALKQFTEVNAAALAMGIGSRKITVSNQRHEVTKLDDHPSFAGHPTDHYRVTLDYDITMTFGQMPLTQSVHTVIDKWTTIAFGDVDDAVNAAGGNTRTGNPQLDELIEFETTKVHGFALRETVQTTTTSHRSTAPGSKLNVSPVRTQTREILITSIREVQPSAADFIVPAAFRRIEPGQNLPKAPAATQLSLDPAGN
jgi:hypothetical protein